MVKMLGIAYIAEFSSSICKDCGHSAIASQIELFAKGAIVVMSIPVMSCLIELIGELILICKKIYFDNNHIGCSDFLPQCFVYASDTEITDKIEQQMLEKIDMSEIEKYSKDYLPDRLSFSDIVDAILAGDQKAGEKICEYIYELFL